MLSQLPLQVHPDLLAGTHRADDAAVFRLSDELALVQTVDFFTPIVDDPFVYGQIAAANSLSDVYAVGGTPLTALNIVAFPMDTLPSDVLASILMGGATMVARAGAVIVGGHTVDDPEPKYGLAVTGVVNPEKHISPVGARPGDLLVLTKPIGTGTIATALKRDLVDAGDLEQAVRWMTTLNASASSAMVRAGCHAATDVTGFGLIGHLSELADASGVAATLHLPSVPLLPGARRYIESGCVPAGTQKNWDYVRPAIRTTSRLSQEDSNLLADPQTSGGLLIALPSDAYDAFRALMEPPIIAACIGEIVEGEPGSVMVELG